MNGNAGDLASIDQAWIDELEEIDVEELLEDPEPTTKAYERLPEDTEPPPPTLPSSRLPGRGAVSRRKPTILPPPPAEETDVLIRLYELLERAERGELTGLAIVAVTTDGVLHGYVPDPEHQTYAVVGALEDLKMRLLKEC